MNPIDISTDLKRIPIRRDGVNVGEISFNPADVVFAEKFYNIVSEFESKLTQYQSQYDALEKDAKGTPVDMGEALRLLRESCTYIREKIDYVFGAGTCQIVFGDALSLEIFPQFFDGITPLIRTARVEKLQPYLVKSNGKKSKRKVMK